MNIRNGALVTAVLLALSTSLPAQTKTFPIDEIRPGMVGIGRTVFDGDRLEEFKVQVLGVLRNSVGTRRNLILARLEGGPLANTGVIAGMSGSPVYIDGRLVGAVSYSLGQFPKEPIAGITPIDEMREDATLPGPRRQVARIDLPLPLTQEGLRASLSQAFAWMRPFADNPSDVQVLGGTSVNAGMATMLRPIATPLTLGGFDPTVIDPIAAAFRDQGFLPIMAGSMQSLPSASRAAAPPLRPGDPIGVALLNGDLEVGATGTVTDVDGSHVYAFGHPFYGLGPTEFPMTRAHVFGILPSLAASQKIASTGDVIGIVQQDRATTIAGTLGPGPTMIPIKLTLNSERGTRKTFNISMVRDQLLTPLLAYVSILNTLTSYERQNGVGTYAVKGSATLKKYGDLSFEDLFTGDQPSVGAAASIVGPINLLLRNAFEDVEFSSLNLEIDASEQPRSATLERVWVSETRVRPGSTATVNVLLRTYRGDQVTKSIPIQIPANARGSVSIMVADGVRLSQFETRELQVQPMQTRGLPQMIRVLNGARKNNRLYVRLVTRDDGAVVKGESLAALPGSVLAVMESDRSGGSFRPLQTALVGDWEITPGLAVTGTRTLTVPLEE
ncbi:MAG TPA: SpoIVB peptidase S55 domain-containing protein [Vicinamibacterales bacterium]|jgi:hypothetical protein